MVTTDRRLTSADLERMPDGDRIELIDGVPLEMVPPDIDHGDAAGLLIRRIGAFLDAHDPDGLVGPEIAFGFGPDPDPVTVLLPDVAYLRSDRVPPRGERGGVCRIPPDLAVEILSPSNTAVGIEAKVAVYLDGGARMVWVFNPLRRAVTVHLPDRTARTLVEDDVLDGGDVLPGFALPVRDVFR
jgi:Uma2 family endonuclease